MAKKNIFWSSYKKIYILPIFQIENSKTLIFNYCNDNVL